MPDTILYRELRRALDDGAQLVEVLPRPDYDELHIPGAVSIPIKQLDRESASQLSRDRAVVTYCWDSVCDLSARAARRFADLGFPDVYDYFPSKVDWMARGLTLEGRRAKEPRAADFTGPPVITCGPADALEAVRAKVEDSAYGFALVLDEERIVLGRLRGAALRGEAETLAGRAMEEGPSTNRPNVEPAKLLEKLSERDLRFAILTDPEGRLIGVVRRRDLERELG